MSPIHPYELSAFLDGELAPERAREIEQALESDAALRSELESLALDDTAWRSAGASASFRPDLRHSDAATVAPLQPLVTAPRVLALGTLLVAAKLAPRLIEAIGISFTLQGCMLAVLLYVVWTTLKRETEGLA